MGRSSNQAIKTLTRLLKARAPMEELLAEVAPALQSDNESLRKAVLKFLVRSGDRIWPLLPDLLQLTSGDLHWPKYFIAQIIVESDELPPAEEVLPALFAAYDQKDYRDTRWMMGRAIRRYKPEHDAWIAQLIAEKKQPERAELPFYI